MWANVDQFNPPPHSPCPRTSTKLSRDGKSSWQVYKTRFFIFSEVNVWDSAVKSYHLITYLLGDAGNILWTLSDEQRHNFDAFSSSLILRFGGKYLKYFSRL